MKTVVARAAAIWLVIAILAVVNGLVRESVLVPGLGSRMALPLSGITLSLVVLAVTYFCFPFLHAANRKARWLVGIQWVLMTLAFEFLFGHFVAGKSWSTLVQVFDVRTGDLFVLVLLVSLVAPSLVGGARGE